MSSQVTISTKPTLKRSRRASSTARGTKKSRAGISNVSRSLVTVGRTFPKKIRTVLRYVENNAITCTASSYQQYFFKCNGMYDPTDALGGHKPYGFNQYAAIYNHYHVYKAVCTVQFTNYNDADPGFIVGINITPGSSDADTTQTKMEKQDGKKNYRTIAAGQPIVTITKTWTDKAYFGDQSNEDSMSAAVTADPTELSHFCVWAQNLNSAGTENCGALVTVEYYVEFIEPKSLGGS